MAKSFSSHIDKLTKNSEENIQIFRFAYSHIVISTINHPVLRALIYILKSVSLKSIKRLPFSLGQEEAHMSWSSDRLDRTRKRDHCTWGRGKTRSCAFSAQPLRRRKLISWNVMILIELSTARC